VLDNTLIFASSERKQQRAHPSPRTGHPDNVVGKGLAGVKTNMHVVGNGRFRSTRVRVTAMQDHGHAGSTAWGTHRCALSRRSTRSWSSRNDRGRSAKCR